MVPRGGVGLGDSPAPGLLPPYGDALARHLLEVQPVILLERLAELGVEHSPERVPENELPFLAEPRCCCLHAPCGE
eukprot:1811080-Pyramimonas_sp.AAC.1